MTMIYLPYRPRYAGYYWVKICPNLSKTTEPPQYIERIVKVFSTCHDGDGPEEHSGRRPNMVCLDGDTILIEDPRLLAFAGPIPKPEDDAPYSTTKSQT